MLLSNIWSDPFWMMGVSELLFDCFYTARDEVTDTRGHWNTDACWQKAFGLPDSLVKKEKPLRGGLKVLVWGLLAFRTTEKQNVFILDFVLGAYL